MAATSVPRLAGVSAPGLRLDAALRVAVLTAALAAGPWLARTAPAQQSAAIRASVVVTHSILGVRLRPDTSAARPAALPLERQLAVADLGTVVVSGPREEVRVARRIERAPGRSAVVVQVACVDS